MSTVLLILIIVVCVLLIAVILMQNSKGGIAAGLNTISQVAGVRASSDIEKFTWILGISLFVLCVFSTTSISSSKNEVQEVKSEVQEYINENGVLPTNPSTSTPVDVKTSEENN